MLSNKTWYSATQIKAQLNGSLGLNPLLYINAHKPTLWSSSATLSSYSHLFNYSPSPPPIHPSWMNMHSSRLQIRVRYSSHFTIQDITLQMCGVASVAGFSLDYYWDLQPLDTKTMATALTPEFLILSRFRAQTHKHPPSSKCTHTHARISLKIDLAALIWVQIHMHGGRYTHCVHFWAMPQCFCNIGKGKGK